MDKKNTNATVFLVTREGWVDGWVCGRGEKERFQQSASTHSGPGDKEALNIDAVGIE